MIDRDQALNDAHHIVAPLDAAGGERILAAAAVLFAAVAERYAASPPDLHAYGQRVLRGDRFEDTVHHTKTDARMESLRDFFRDRIAIRRAN